MNNKKIISLVVIIGVVVAWYAGITGVLKETGGYDNYIRVAKSYADEQLYEKAIAEYKSALSYEDSLELRLTIIDMYLSGIKTGEITSDGNLVALLLDTMAKYNNSPKAFEVSCEYFLSILDYDELVNAMKMANNKNIVSSRMNEIRNQIRYLYDKRYGTLSEPSRLTNGYYILKEEGDNYSLAQNMTKGKDFCEFITPYSSTGETIIKKDGKVFLLGSDGVRQKYFDDNIIASSGLSDGLIACKIGEVWAYYDVEGKKVSEDYYYAGRFEYGVAAVQKEAGKWQLINTQFKPLTDTIYKDIKLNTEDACASAGVVFVKSGDNYEMISINGYDKENPAKVSLKKVDKFSCQELDMPVDANINSNKGVTWFAYKDASSQKWGYADVNGKIVIKPKFEEAKSFSNGFAAVREGEFWCFANEDGDIVIRPEASNAAYFNSLGCCMVQFDGGYWTYIRMYYWEN